MSKEDTKQILQESGRHLSMQTHWHSPNVALTSTDNTPKTGYKCDHLV